MDQRLLTDLKAAIRSIPDYPKPGIVFRDITTLLGDARAFRRSVDELVHPFAGGRVDKVAGIEARGFILGGAIAHQNATKVARLIARVAKDFPAEHEPCPAGSDRALDGAIMTAPSMRDPALIGKLDAVAGRVLAG